MTTGTGTHRNDSIDTGLGRFLCVPALNHIMKDQPAPAMNRFVQLGHRTQGRNHQRNFMPG